jgi:hypothetical protein
MNHSTHLETYFRTWMERDPSKVAALYGTAAVLEDPTLDEPARGRDAIERYFADMFGTLENPVHVLTDWATRENRVWFEWEFKTGGVSRPMESYHGVSIQTLEDGLVIHDAAFWIPAR